MSHFSIKGVVIIGAVLVLAVAAAPGAELSNIGRGLDGSEVTCDHGWVPGPTGKCYLFDSQVRMTISAIKKICNTLTYYMYRMAPLTG